MYVLLEKAAKDAKEGRKPQLPLWLAPTQVRIIPLKDEFLDFSKDIATKLSEKNIRVDIDDRNDSIGKRIREAEKEWIRYILVIGEKEVNSDNLSVRDRNTSNVRNLSFDEFTDEINEFTSDKPFSKRNMPLLLSKRPIIQV
jgi:threonyl-tRNA synthetase